MILGLQKWLGKGDFFAVSEKRNTWKMEGRDGAIKLGSCFFWGFTEGTQTGYHKVSECEQVPHTPPRLPVEKNKKLQPHTHTPPLFSSQLLFSSIISSVFLSSFSFPLSFLLFSSVLPPLLSPFLRARLWSVDRISGKQFGNPNLSEIIWLQPPITCWFGGIRSSLRSNDFHFVFEL